MCGEVLEAQQDIPATGEHTWGEWSKVDDTNHKRTCSVCQGEETAAHTWNDDTCSACGAEKPSTPDTPTGNYTLSYEASDREGIVIRNNIPTTTGKYRLIFSSDSGDHKTGISSNDYSTYPLAAMFAGKPTKTYTSLTWTETIGDATTTIATLNKSLTIAEGGDAIGIAEFKATRDDNPDYEMWNIEISVNDELDPNAAYVLYHYIDAGRGSGCTSLKVKNGKLVSTSGSSQYAADNTVSLHVLRVSGSVDENGNATLTYTPMGTAFKWTVPAAETTE